MLQSTARFFSAAEMSLVCAQRYLTGIGPMIDDQLRTGRITKVVHVRFAADANSRENNLDDCHGYGVLHGSDGQDMYFVDTALQDARFAELKVGQNALYVTDIGPLGIAAKVWIATTRPSTL